MRSSDEDEDEDEDLHAPLAPRERSSRKSQRKPLNMDYGPKQPTHSDSEDESESKHSVESGSQCSIEAERAKRDAARKVPRERDAWKATVNGLPSMDDYPTGVGPDAVQRWVVFKAEEMVKRVNEAITRKEKQIEAAKAEQKEFDDKIERFTLGAVPKKKKKKKKKQQQQPVRPLDERLCCRRCGCGPFPNNCERVTHESRCDGPEW